MNSRVGSVRMLMITDLSFVSPSKGVQLILSSRHTVTESGLTSLFPARSSTQRGPPRQIYGRVWKQQLAVPHEREANLVYIQSAISSPLKP